MSEGEHKASVQHTPAEWTSSNQDQYVNADKARYNSEKVSTEHRHAGRGHLSSAGQEPGIPPHQRHPEQNITVSPDHRRGRTYNFILLTHYSRDQENVNFQLKERVRLVRAWRCDLQQVGSSEHLQTVVSNMFTLVTFRS